MSWNAKLSLVVAMRDAWANLDLGRYPVGSASRAAKAMELVTQTVRDILRSFSCSYADIVPFRVAYRPGLTASP